MPYRSSDFKEGLSFHIISRAVEERKILNDENDCYRFIFQINAANLGRPNYNLHRMDIIKCAKSLLRGEKVSDKFIIKEHSPLVHILDFAFNVTHYHFHLLPTGRGSLSEFMYKLNMGFAKYFNLKHNRKGSLFGGRYKSVPIETDFQLDAVGRYVSIINPLDVYQPGWREKGLKDPQKAFEFLKNYQFSSFPDRIRKRKSSILAPEEILEKYCLKENSKEDYISFTKDFLSDSKSFPKKIFGQFN